MKTCISPKQYFTSLLKSCCVLIVLNLPICMNAAIIQWTGNVDSNWNEAGNWSSNSVPTSADEVLIHGVFTVNVPANNTFQVGSLSLMNCSVTIGSNGTIAVGSLSVPSIGFSAIFDNVTFINNGNLEITGGLQLINNSSMTNNGDVVDYGSVNNATMNYLFDSNSTFINNVSGKINSNNNIDPLGNHKQVFIKIDNQAVLTNYGQIFNSYSSSIEDYLIKGMELKNGGQFINSSGFVNLNWIQEIGIHVYNDIGNIQQSLLENDAALRIRETDVDTDNTSIAIKIETNGKYSRLANEVLTMAYAGTFVPGFDNTTPQIDVNGIIAYLSTSAAFDPGVLALNSNSSLSGTGPINNEDIGYLGCQLLPGSSPGIITFNDPFAPTGPIELEMEMGGTAGAGIPTGGHDQIVFTTSPNDISAVDLKVVLIDDFIPSINDQFVLVDGAYSGTFQSVDFPGDESSWQLNYNANDITLTLNSPLLNVGNVGFGTTAPLTKVHVKEGDVYIEEAGSGVIMKDANGDCRKLTIDSAGVLSAVLITCPQ